MRALRFSRFGDPDVLHVTDLPDPVARHDCEAVIEVKAASVNPSDLKNVAGRMEGTTLPRTPGRNFAGVVVGGPPGWIGAEVWGTGGDIGFSRDGSHAQLLAIPATALARKPERLSFEEAAVVGVDFVVGWLGLVEAARLTAWESVVVFGVSGGVGGAVAQIARALGARVIGVDRVEPAPTTPAASALDAFVVLGDPQDVAAGIGRHTSGRGADVVYDAVGGVTTPAALASLAHGGRLVVISSVGTRTVEIDLIDLYHNETRILGCDSRRLDVTRSSARLDLLLPFFEREQFRPLPVTGRCGLENGKDAYTAVANGARGRLVMCP